MSIEKKGGIQSPIHAFLGDEFHDGKMWHTIFSREFLNHESWSTFPFHSRVFPFSSFSVSTIFWANWLRSDKSSLLRKRRFAASLFLAGNQLINCVIDIHWNCYMHCKQSTRIILISLPLSCLMFFHPGNPSPSPPPIMGEKMESHHGGLTLELAKEEEQRLGLVPRAVKLLKAYQPHVAYLFVFGVCGSITPFLPVYYQALGCTGRNMYIPTCLHIFIITYVHKYTHAYMHTDRP